MKRFDIVLVDLNPTRGSEIKKQRPCVIVSPDELNTRLKTLIIAPLTSKSFLLPTRLKTNINHKQGLIVCDQIRTIDKSRVIRKLDTLDKKTSQKLANLLCEMFEF